MPSLLSSQLRQSSPWLARVIITVVFVEEGASSVVMADIVDDAVASAAVAGIFGGRDVVTTNTAALTNNVTSTTGHTGNWSILFQNNVARLVIVPILLAIPPLLLLVVGYASQMTIGKTSNSTIDSATIRVISVTTRTKNKFFFVRHLLPWVVRQRH